MFLLRLRRQGLRDLGVLRAIEMVPRRVFAPARHADLAALNTALPLDHGQTMSDPFHVARVIEALGPQTQDHVLDVGTGSGYATAVLARMTARVTSVERCRALAAAAREHLEQAPAPNATVDWADGLDLPRSARPFDRIVVHAALSECPATLLDRLAPGGTLIFAEADAADPGALPLLKRLTRDMDGAVKESALWRCRLQRAGRGRIG